ncbi:Windbeutel [Operophtera brumata]|uniref:Windbeutel n=1 Tax=Operophtera brumata TaxID=104452 RepID=A0A0L7K985_OPEBR|nr:Windbeutel [Operophtera brumata]
MRGYLVLLCVIFAIPFAYQSTTTPSGSVNLDELSFYKVTNKFEASLVKFDVAYPYGDRHDAFVAVAKDANDVDDLLVAEVGVKDYGEKENEGLAMKYGATKDNFPIVKLFVKGKSDPLTFDDAKGFTSDELRRFVRKNTGIYLSLPGCVRELDILAIKFMKSKEDERKEVLKEVVEKKVADKKVIEKGDEFITTEDKRVKKLLNGKVSNEKKKELEIRLNILQTFQLLNKEKRGKEEL